MSKMGDMAAAIEDLRQCAATINETDTWLVDLFTSQNPEIVAQLIRSWMKEEGPK